MSSRLLERDHAARCGVLGRPCRKHARVLRPGIAWCSRPRSAATFTEGALVVRRLGLSRLGLGANPQGREPRNRPEHPGDEEKRGGEEDRLHRWTGWARISVPGKGFLPGRQQALYRIRLQRKRIWAAEGRTCEVGDRHPALRRRRRVRRARPSPGTTSFRTVASGLARAYSQRFSRTGSLRLRCRFLSGFRCDEMR
jgi:hypothetical protein